MKKFEIKKYHNPSYEKMLSDMDLKPYYFMGNDLVIVKYALLNNVRDQTYYETECGKIKHASRFKKLSNKQAIMLSRSKKIEKIIN